MSSTEGDVVDRDYRDDIIGMLRAQIRLLGHMPCVVENREAAAKDKRMEKDLMSELSRLRSENERYREALEELAAPAAYAMPDADRVQAYRDVARDAIKEPTNG